MPKIADTPEKEDGAGIGNFNTAKSAPKTNPVTVAIMIILKESILTFQLLYIQ